MLKVQVDAVGCGDRQRLSSFGIPIEEKIRVRCGINVDDKNAIQLAGNDPDRDSRKILSEPALDYGTRRCLALVRPPANERSLGIIRRYREN
jgi:hypothetical protein